METIFDEITYKNIKKAGEVVGAAPISFSDTTEFPGSDTEYGGIINAIDIDWNGAEIDEQEINTTSDLLRYIQGAYSSNPSELAQTIQDLTDRITALEGKLNGITNSDLTSMKSNSAKLDDTAITKNSLKNVINNAVTTLIYYPYLDNPDQSYKRYPASMKIKLAKDGTITKPSENTSFYANPNEIQSKSGTEWVSIVSGVKLDNKDPYTGVIQLKDRFDDKLDKTAISYNDATETLTVNK